MSGPQAADNTEKQRDLSAIMEDASIILDRMSRIEVRLADIHNRLFGPVPQIDSNSPERPVDVGILDQFRSVTGRSMDVLASAEDVLSRIEHAV